MTEPLPSAAPPDFDRLNSAQRTARRRAQLDMSRAHPDQYVVYLDTWTGDSLERRVLVVADGLAECHRLMDDLPAELRERTTVTRTPAPDAFVVPTSVVG